MKQKYIVMALTFLVMIAITPFIFSKLMNAKLNKMIKNLNNEGYHIKLIENKSSYIKTDKVFLVDIPGDKLNSNFIDNLEFKIEIIFKNLPVTRVDFRGVLKKIDSKYDVKFLQNKIRFFATTPNFKVYDYRVENLNLNIDNSIFEVKGIKGIFEYNKSNKLNIDDIVLKDKNFLIEFKNVKNDSFYKKDSIKNENRFDFYAKTKNANIQVNNVKILTTSLIDKKISVLIKVSFENLVSSILNIRRFEFNLNFLNLDISTFTKNLKEDLALNLLKKGFEVRVNSKARDVEVMGNEVGYYMLKAHLKVLPDNNLEEDLKNNNLKFLTSTIHYESSPEMATLFMNLIPESAFVFALAKKTGEKVILDINLKNSKLFVNGEEIK